METIGYRVCSVKTQYLSLGSIVEHSRRQCTTSNRIYFVGG